MLYPEAQRLIEEMVRQSFIRVAPVATGEGGVFLCISSSKETCG